MSSRTPSGAVGAAKKTCSVFPAALLFLLLLLHPHTEQKKSSTGSQETPASQMYSPAPCGRGGAAPDSTTGCRTQQTQPPEKHLQLVAVQHVDADAHSFLLHSAVHIWHLFLCLLSPPSPFILFFFSKMTLPDSLRSSSRLGGSHRKGAQENKNVNH